MYLCAGFYSAVLNGCDVRPQEQSTLNSVMAETAVLNCFKVTEWKHTGCKCRSKFHLGNIMPWWQGVRGRGDRQHPSTFGDF